MSLIEKLAAWRAVSDPHQRIDPLDAARDNILNKATKIELAQQAILTRHLAEISKDDVEDVRKLKANKLGGAFAMNNKSGGQSGGGDEDVGDIIICDDFHQNDPPRSTPPSRAWPMALGLILGGGLIAGAIILPKLLENNSTNNSTNQIVQPKNTTTNTTIKKGFIIDLPDAPRIEPKQ